MHTHTFVHLHIGRAHTRTQRGGEWKSYSSRRALWEFSPVPKVHNDHKIPIFHLTGANPKAEWPAKTNSAAQPYSNGVQWRGSTVAGSRTPDGRRLGDLRAHPIVSPLATQVMPGRRQSPALHMLPAEEWIGSSISAPSQFPLLYGRMLSAKLHGVFSASSQCQWVLDTLCIIKHESEISMMFIALLILAVCVTR